MDIILGYIIRFMDLLILKTESHTDRRVNPCALEIVRYEQHCADPHVPSAAELPFVTHFVEMAVLPLIIHIDSKRRCGIERGSCLLKVEYRSNADEIDIAALSRYLQDSRIVSHL